MTAESALPIGRDTRIDRRAAGVNRQVCRIGHCAIAQVMGSIPHVFTL